MTPGTVVTILPKGWKGTVVARHSTPWFPMTRVGGMWLRPSQITTEPIVPVVRLPKRTERRPG